MWGGVCTLVVLNLCMRKRSYNCIVRRAVQLELKKKARALFLSAREPRAERNRLFFNFYANFYAYLLQLWQHYQRTYRRSPAIAAYTFFDITTLCAIFYHIFSPHAQKRLFVHLLSKFWHRRWIQWPWIKQGYFCDRLSFASYIKFGTRVFDKILEIEYSNCKKARLAQP